MPNTPTGAHVARILLPRPGIDLEKWAVIACDQFTSEPDYWQAVADTVGGAPSTYQLVLPEIFLGGPEEARRTVSIRQAMEDYLQRALLVEHEGLVLVERSAGGRVRHGLMMALDLEQYDFRAGSGSLIRATEGTILERIPPRVRIRQGAPLEVPHIMVLIDDPERTVIEPLVAAQAGGLSGLEKVYDVELMLGSGHLRGHLIHSQELARQAMAALEELADPDAFAARYGLPAGSPVLLFAMGDGNHSLATAKTIWDQLKPQVGMDHPARYALVEIENIHDPGLVFEPIFRALFGVKADWFEELDRFYGGRCRRRPCATVQEMVETVDAFDQGKSAQAVGAITPDGCFVAVIAGPPAVLPVGTLQAFLDCWQGQGGFEKIDYVHGQDVTVRLGSQAGNVSFYLPGIAKSDFFRTVILDGALPRKTFSMGEAREKRFYMEARRIVC